MFVILFLLCLQISFSQDDNKFKVLEYEGLYGNIPNQNGFNNLVYIKQRAYDVFYDKKGTYPFIESNQNFSHNSEEYFFSLGIALGLKFVLIPENYILSNYRIDFELGFGGLTFSSESYLSNWNWLIPEIIGASLNGNLNLRYKKIGLSLGYSQFFGLPFSQSINVGLIYRKLKPKEFYD
jgi:hypothetical protein